jgi:hypothetical protein
MLLKTSESAEEKRKWMMMMMMMIKLPFYVSVSYPLDITVPFLLQ